MSITQLSVIARNEPGVMARIVQLLDRSCIKIYFINTAELYESGIARLILDLPFDAIDILEKDGFVLATTEINAIELECDSAVLADFLGELAVRMIDIAYLTLFTRINNPRKTVVIFKTKHLEIEAVLTEMGLKQLTLDDLAVDQL